MTDKAIEVRRAYKREWARRNRDKIRQYQAAYWERRAEQEGAADNEKNRDR